MRLEKIRIILERISMFDNMKRKFKYNFVSEIDQFIQELNNLPNAKSNSRLELEQKYARINALRDHPQVTLAEELPWKDF